MVFYLICNLNPTTHTLNPIKPTPLSRQVEDEELGAHRVILVAKCLDVLIVSCLSCNPEP